MAGLGYLLSGAAPGVAQGRQIAWDRQNQLAQRDLANRQLAEQTAARQQQLHLEDLAQKRAALGQLDEIVNNPNAHLDAIVAAARAKRFGLLQQNPELDVAGEVQAYNDSQQAAENAARGASNDILGHPGTVNPSVSGQPAIPAQSQAIRDQEGADLAGPRTYLPNHLAGPPEPASMVPGTNSQPSPARPSTGLSAPSGGTVEGQTTQAVPFPSATGDVSQSYSIPNGPGAPVDQNAPIKAAINRFFNISQDASGRYSNDDKNNAAITMASLTKELADSGDSEARAFLTRQQGSVAVPLATAQIGKLGAEQKQTEAQTKEIHPTAVAQRSLLGSQAKQAGAETEAIPQRVKQGQESLALQKAAQDITRAQDIADVKLRTRALDQSMKQFGFSRDQFETTKKGLLAQYAHTQAEAYKMASDPDFNAQAIIKTIQDNAYITNPSSGQKAPGPTYDAYQSYLKDVQSGNGPTLYHNSFVTGGQGGGQPGGFDVQGYLSTSKAPASVKVQQLKKFGVAPPDWLSKQAAAEVKQQ